jgi:hypothetical protein
MERLKSVLMGLATDIANNILPRVTSLTDKFADFVGVVREGAGLLQQDLNNFKLAGLRAEFIGTANRINEFNRRNDELRDSIRRLAGSNDDFTKIDHLLKEFGRQIANNEKMLRPLYEKMQKLREEINLIEIGPWSTSVEFDKPAAPDVVGQTAIISQAVQTAKDQITDFIDTMSGLPVLMGQSFAFDTLPFEQAMAKVNAAYQNQVMTFEQGQRIKLQLQRQEQQAMLDTASMAAQTLTAVFQKEKWAAVGAAAINTAVGVTKALSSGYPPWNFAQAALVAAQGAAQIAAIKSATATGGGSVPSVGGSGAAGGDSAGAGRDSTLFVQGISPTDLLSGEVVREMYRRSLSFNGTVAG